MKNLQQYQPELDQLSDEEQQHLEHCLRSVKEFVEHSKKINKTSYATRDAHSKTYAVANAELKIDAEIPELVRSVFSKNNYEVTVRFSHANPVINRSKNEMPAFGMALKIKDLDDKEANFPLANFPLFPVKSVSGFLKFFTSLNTFLITKADNFVVSAMDLPLLALHSGSLLPPMFGWDMMKNFSKILKRKNDFILSFDYHSIGCYRLGTSVIKIKAVPRNPFPDFHKNQDQRSRIEDFIAKNEMKFDILIQFCENLEDQPVNDLTKEWKNAPFTKIGTLIIPQNSLFNPQLPEVESLNFNPFENPESLLPVGKIQQLRKEIYRVSIETRNSLNPSN